MRLVTRTIWRAFPELDRFDDEQCRRFVRAASRGIVSRSARWVAVAAAGVLGVALLPVLSLLEHLCIQRGWWSRPVLGRLFGQPRWMGELVYIGLMLVTLFLLGGFFGAVTRDFLLRRRVRRVLRTRGRCAQCTYFLGGLPVSSRLQVVCPECGYVTEVDRSLGELHGSEDGTARFAPSDSVIRDSDPWLTPKRLWKWTKRVAAAAAVVALVAGAGWGWHEWRLAKQATRAMALKPGAPALIALMEKAQGAAALDDATNGFDLFRPIAAKMATAQADLYPSGFPPSDKAASHSLYFGGEWVAPRPQPGDTPRTLEERALNEPHSASLLAEFERRGVFRDLEKMVEAPVAIGIAQLPRQQPLIGVYFSEYTKFRQVARWNGGRMRQAVRDNDPYRFADAFGLTLGMARMLEKQPVLIGRLVAIAMEALAYGELRQALLERHDQAWLDAIDAALKKYERHEPRALPYEGERLSTTDTVCWVFATPSNVRFGKYSPALRKGLGMGMAIGGGSGGIPDGRLGTLEENLEYMDAFYEAFIADAALPRYKRAAPPLPMPKPGLVLVDMLLPALDKSLRSQDQAEIDRAAAPILIALERYRLANGVYPPALTELSPGIVPSLPPDPWSGKPFGYKRVDPAGDPQGRGYILYGVGTDGVDNGGTAGSSPWDALHNFAPAGIDYIINDVNR